MCRIWASAGRSMLNSSPSVPGSCLGEPVGKKSRGDNTRDSLNRGDLPVPWRVLDVFGPPFPFGFDPVGRSLAAGFHLVRRAFRRIHLGIAESVAAGLVTDILRLVLGGVTSL